VAALRILRYGKTAGYGKPAEYGKTAEFGTAGYGKPVEYGKTAEFCMPCVHPAGWATLGGAHASARPRIAVAGA